MIEIGGEKVFIGDFHTHWYWDKENPTLFVAGMYNLGLDFALLCGDYSESKNIDSFCKIYEVPFRCFPGKEICTEKAHIVCWVDKNFEKKLEDIPENPYKFLKEKTKLVILAHPGKNWADAYNGSYKPLLSLYRNNLIDAIQPQEYEPYKIFKKENVKISVVGGFDIHACKPFIKYPFYLFKKRYPVFKHITPCSAYTTLVVAKDFNEKSIISAIKNKMAVSFNVETYEFIGNEEIVSFLKSNGFIKKWKEEIRKRQNTKIKGGIIIGEKSKIFFKTDKEIKYFILPDNSFYKSRKLRKREIIVSQILKRENFYVPLTIKKGDITNFYGILVKSPVKTKILPLVKKTTGNYTPFIEILLQNRMKKNLKLNLNVLFNNEKEEFILNLSTRKRLLIPVSVDSLSSEYRTNIEIQSKKFNIDYDLKISFPICKYGKNPWHIDKETSIKIKKENIYNIEYWNGKDDLSGDINLYWDENNFYLYAEIIDDIFYQIWEDWETFWGDSIQFSFSPSLTKIDSYGFNYELVIAKTKKGNEIFVWNKYGTTQQVKKLYKGGFLDIVRDEENKKIIYKLKIPWKFFKEFKPKETKRFLFSLIVFDNDGIIMKRKWAFYGENIAVRKSMKNSHAVILLK